MSEERVEAAEPEDVETVSERALAEQDQQMNGDGMDAVIEVAAKMESYSKAMDTIINAIIKRAYPGDFVCHAKQGDPEEKKKANIGAAAAERIATFLGIQERNWTVGAKVWSDDHKHYTYTYEADFGFKNRWVHAIGQAGTRDVFFSLAYGKPKPLEDIREDHIRTAAFRATRKEGVRLLLGIRSIPIKKLVELGYTAGEINYVNFESKGNSLDESAKEINKDTGMSSKEIVISEIQPKEGTNATTKKTWRRLDIRDANGTIWLMWSAPGGKGRREGLLVDSLERKSPIKVEFQAKKTDRGEQYEIIKINGEIDQ